MPTTVSAGCTRITIDLPTALLDRVRTLSEAPPESISISEWVRRVIAHHAAFPLPSARERARARVRIDGATIKRSGRPKNKQPLPVVSAPKKMKLRGEGSQMVPPQMAPPQGAQGAQGVPGG